VSTLGWVAYSIKKMKMIYIKWWKGRNTEEITALSRTRSIRDYGGGGGAGGGSGIGSGIGLGGGSSGLGSAIAVSFLVAL
jgi:uncharacterized membrane protein YgcG